MGHTLSNSVGARIVGKPEAEIGNRNVERIASVGVRVQFDIAIHHLHCIGPIGSGKVPSSFSRSHLQLKGQGEFYRARARP